METENVYININPLTISYYNQKFPIAPDGRSSEIEDFPDALATYMLSTIPQILCGEICQIEFYDNPQELIIIPWGNDITIYLNTQLTEKYVNWQQITVPTGAWFPAVIKAAWLYIEDFRKSGEESLFYTPEEIEYLIGITEKVLQARGYLSHEENP
jgi:hypothetical protein